jgi:hypothetical protein
MVGVVTAAQVVDLQGNDPKGRHYIFESTMKKCQNRPPTMKFRLIVGFPIC